MDKMAEATVDIGKRHDATAILTAPGNGKLHQQKTKEKRGTNVGRVVRATGRKDRHNKVRTAAGGTRARRVRLSPKTAILFYDLQDRLGCDRPSKAIDWLMTEAKAAIDALGDSPAAAANYNHSTAESKGCNMMQEHSTDLLNGKGGGEGGGGENYQEQPTSVELFDANSEIVRLQRIFSWNYGAILEDYSSAPLHYPAPAADFRAFAEREPLQSSYSSRINTNYPQFQGFGFSDQELPNFCAAATFKEDEMLALSKSSSTASFLHYLG